MKTLIALVVFAALLAGGIYVGNRTTLKNTQTDLKREVDAYNHVASKKLAEKAVDLIAPSLRPEIRGRYEQRMFTLGRPFGQMADSYESVTGDLLRVELRDLTHLQGMRRNMNAHDSEQNERELLQSILDFERLEQVRKLSKDTWSISLFSDLLDSDNEMSWEGLQDIRNRFVEAKRTVEELFAKYGHS